MAEEPSAVRLRFADNSENESKIVWDEHTRRTSQGAKAYPVGENEQALPLMGSTSLFAGSQSKVIIEAKSDAATDVVESEESSGAIPVILKNIRNPREVTKRILNLGDDNGDFADFNATDDVTLNSTSFTKLGSFEVPAGFMLTLDPSRKVHIFLGDDT